MQDESKPTPKPTRTLEDFYRETRAERDLIAARRRLQTSMNQPQGGPPMQDEDKRKKPEPNQHKHPAEDFLRATRAERAARAETVRAMIYTPPPYGSSPPAETRLARS